jgi:hypothetical protein
LQPQLSQWVDLYRLLEQLVKYARTVV